MRNSILTALFALILSITGAKANEVLDFFNDFVGDMAPVITNCNYGNSHSQPVDELCALLEGGGLVAGVGKPDTRIGLLVASLGNEADEGRTPELVQEAEDLLTQWYDQMGIELKRCTTSPLKLAVGDARFGFCTGTQVSDLFKQRLTQCSHGTTTACKVSWEEWILIGSSLDVVEKSHPLEQKDWDALRNALDAYSQRDN